MNGSLVLLRSTAYPFDVTRACDKNNNPDPAKLIELNFHHLKLCLATAIHNFKWPKNTYICLIRAQILANLDV